MSLHLHAHKEASSVISCFAVQVVIGMGSWALVTVMVKLLQWLCLAHITSHSYQQPRITRVAYLSTGLRCAGVSMG
jgi:hypothetical protein